MKKYGRAFNHLEDLVFFYGYEGVCEAITHIDEICEDSSSVRMKWDGGLQIYWGREYVNGPLILTGHNGWARGSKSTTTDELYDFIVNKSGKDRENVTDERKKFASHFASLFPLFDAATPKDFVGFVYADALYLSKPHLVDDEFNFHPNHTGYMVQKDTNLGKRIDKSSLLLVGHAYFDAFGLKDEDQTPLDNFDMFNNTDELIVLNPYYSKVKIKVELGAIRADLYNGSTYIDRFLAPIDGVSGFRDYIYKWVNYTVKTESISTFENWIRRQSFISTNQQHKIHQRILTERLGYNKTFAAINRIRFIKNRIIDQLEQNDCEVKAYNPEGWVRYADDTKKFGNIKLVPRDKWIP